MPFFHLDRRAGDLAARAAFLDPDQLLNTKEVADWLGVAPISLRIWRSKGEGPPIVRVSRRGVRYQRKAVVQFLRDRTCRFAHEHEHDAEAASRPGS